jgi:hypothetical protein
MHHVNEQETGKSPEKAKSGQKSADQAAMDFLVHVDGHPICPCGQELDTCRRAHCPRCGHRLSEESVSAEVA